MVGTFIIFNVLMRKQRHREVDGFFPKSSSYPVAEFLSSEYESCPEESKQGQILRNTSKSLIIEKFLPK